MYMLPSNRKMHHEPEKEEKISTELLQCDRRLRTSLIVYL